MPAEKTAAVVLRVIEFSETSCVVTLYTEEFGKVSALAKGARRPRSPFEGAIDLLSICRIVFLRKSVDVLDLLTEARLLRRFRSASTHLSRFYAAMYVIELVSALTEHADPQPSLYRTIVESLQALDEQEQTATRLLQFELRLLNELGHLPALRECVECGRPVQRTRKDDSVAFGMLAGGVYCDSCRIGKRSIVKLRWESLQWMRRLGELAGTDKGVSETISPYELTTDTNNTPSPDCRGELRGVMDQYMANLLGYRPRTTAWLRHVFRD
jgi:DNA repair protein RecO (recombination protein O)